MDQTSDTNSVSWRFFTAVCGLGLAALLAWDGLGLDMALAAPWGGPGGFALRDDWWLSKIMHEGARALAWLVFLALAAGIWRPWGVLASLPLNARVRLFLSVLAALLSVTLLKGLSHTSCPWDLQAFGGSAAYVSHWALGQRDGGGGHCFPAGHASAGFAFVAAYFGLRSAGSPSARWVLGAALLVGTVLGLSQQVRGAHFMSHTLWTAWLSWSMGGVAHFLMQAWVLKRLTRPGKS
jgi:membrane-associated PAP2 superfamily phosphatase